MTYRGRLLFPFLADLRRLDTNATRAASGYDDDFKTTRRTYPNGPAGAAVSTRVELPVVQLRCQVEMGRWEAQRQTASGNAPDTDLTLVFHFEELEAKGLVDAATGDALIRVNDRLVALRRVRDGAIVRAGSRPDVFATEVQPAGIGLGGERNLLVVVFGDRPQGLTA